MTKKDRRVRYTYHLNGTRFTSLTKAAEAFNVNKSTITRWCKSSKKPDCFREQVEETAKEAGQSVPASPEMTPLEYMLAIMRDENQPDERRDQCAHWAAPYVHRRASGKATGKKEERSEKAKAAGKGRFSPSEPPKLNLVK